MSIFDDAFKKHDEEMRKRRGKFEIFENFPPEKQMKKLKQLQQNISRRMKNLRKNRGEIDTSALERAEKMKLTSLRGVKTETDRRKKFYEMSGWLNFKTSTVKGAKEVLKDRQVAIMGMSESDFLKQLKRAHPRYGEKRITKELKKFNNQVKKRWELFNKWKEENEYRLALIPSTIVVQAIKEYTTDKSIRANRKEINEISNIVDGIQRNQSALNVASPKSLNENKKMLDPVIYGLLARNDLTDREKSNIIMNYPHYRQTAQGDDTEILDILIEYEKRKSKGTVTLAFREKYGLVGFR